VWANRIDALLPTVHIDNSDSATLDNVLELLVCSDEAHWKPNDYGSRSLSESDLDNHPEITDFYEYYSGIQESWDGPALLVFSDGLKVGATLDRNGLRPARYSITRMVYSCSFGAGSGLTQQIS